MKQDTKITAERVCNVLEGLSLEKADGSDPFTDAVYKYTHLVRERVCSHKDWEKEFLEVEAKLFKKHVIKEKKPMRK